MIVILGLLKLNIKARQKTRNFDCKLFINTWYRVGYRLELNFFLFAQFLLAAHQAGHRPQKRENWEFETQDRSKGGLSYGWLVSNTVDDYFEWKIAQKTFKLKIEARLLNAGLYMAFKHCLHLRPIGL